MSTYETTKRNERRMEDDEPDFVVFHRVYGYTVNVDTVAYRVDTNDDNDDGYPDGEITTWGDVCTTEQFHRFHGVCRVGVSGVIVTVMLDGVELRD